ncbi:MAG: malto-oligosyltrehalose synthase [Terriglobia bacterium]
MLRIPCATYRVQMNGQFRFRDARNLAPYLRDLGITDLYSSPILQARRGSLHGYDITDPGRLNCEVGDPEDFEALVAQLRSLGMGLLLDIVPNHLAASIENPWWSDVLENGPSSTYATYFDIDWHPPNKTLDNRVLLPILMRRYAEVLENQEMTLALEENGFFLRYGETKLPIAPKSYSRILGYALDNLRGEIGSDAPEFVELGGILAAVADLPGRVALSEVAGERRQRREEIKERLWRLYTGSTAIHKFVDEKLQIFNGKKKDPATMVPLDELLARQPYVLAFAQAANEEINYRRFFSIADLVGVRVEDPLVFDQIHTTILRLVASGAVTGLRVDHIDGLRDPLGYLRRLQERVAPAGLENPESRFYVVVEKILAKNESLPANWLTCGTTGYDFLNVLNGLFVEPRGLKSVEQTYRRFFRDAPEYDDLIYEKKMQIMQTILAVEMRSLGHHLSLLAEADRYARDLPSGDLTQALIEVTACLPVYRTYTRDSDVMPAERLLVEQAARAARRRNPALEPGCLDFLRDVLSLRQRPHLSSEQREARLDFVMRWQQFSGPIMAKGFEDTVLYVYNPLVSLNEVGGAYASGVSVGDFHEFCRERKKSWPHTLNASSTHDTKRSEDVRSRISVLAEFPDEWRRRLFRWSRWNASLKASLDGRSAPDRNEEILLYQTMLGAWPFQDDDVPGFKERLQEYMLKATREAMVHTWWARPNRKHEEALSRFVAALMDPSKSGPFLKDFLAFEKKLGYYGALNALSQLLIKITAPGVPDFYQGTELWDLRLVDPDNRGPVDFDTRTRLLAELRGLESRGVPAMLKDLLEHWTDGRVKLYLTAKALNFRKAHPQLFAEGEYFPVKIRGKQGENVCAFLRRLAHEWALTAAPRFFSRLAPERKLPLGENVWKRSGLELKPGMPRKWSNIVTGEAATAVEAGGQLVLPLSEVFSGFPVALLHAADKTLRE